MVKIITCRRTTSRLPSPLPFNSLFFSFLLSHAFFLFSSPPLSLPLYSLFPSFLFSNPSILTSSFFLYPVRNSLLFLRQGFFSHLGRRRCFSSRVQKIRGSLVAWAS